MTYERNEVWDRLRGVALKRFWLRILTLAVIVSFEIFWLVKGHSFFTTQIDGIIFSIGFVAAFVLGIWVYIDIRVFWNFKPFASDKDIQLESERQSGKVLIYHNNLIWNDSQGKLIGTIPLDKIKAIGEYTTSEGPILDDWFYLFFISQNDIRQVSAYAANLDSVLESLSVRYKCEITGRLFDSTTFQSNIIWPTQFKGKKVYETLTTKSKTIREKIKLTSRQNDEIALTKELKKHLE